MPFISVVIPVYNVESYLLRCVKVLLEQEYVDCEIILVDDGSTDASGDICDSLSLENKNIVVIHKQNEGLGLARNSGLKVAKGEYITFLDADDWVSPYYFETLDDYLRKRNIDVLKFGIQKVSNGIDTEADIPFYKEGFYSKTEINNMIIPGAVGPIKLFDYSINPVMSSCAAAYRVSFLRKKGIEFYSERIVQNEDYLFSLEVLLKAQTVQILHRILYYYDYREGSLSKRYVENIFSKRMVLLNEYERLLVQNNLIKTCATQFYNQCVDSFYACAVNECGRWNRNIHNKKDVIRQVKHIFCHPKCIEAISCCNASNISIKGRAIYFLMKNKQAGLFYYLYCIFSKK